MTENFKSFNPDSFEQFIRVLSLEIFGDGVELFGNGPDGGREAIFKGKVPYPFPTEEKWNGYGVIQAKFKEKSESTEVDQKWALNQLRKELKVWVESSKRQPKPDYFVFCTNVDLTSASNGGLDQAKELIKSATKQLGLKGHAIWDATRLFGYIDKYPNLRQKFAEFFCIGDLLHTLTKNLEPTLNHQHTLRQYLCNELQAHEDAKLSQAGDRSEERIRLSDVFVDLPCMLSNSNMHAGGATALNSLNSLLSISARKLTPDLITKVESDSSPHDLYQNCSRFLFLGGPGSGKSTIGQFFSQIQRAAILDRVNSTRLEHPVKMLIKSIKEKAKIAKLAWPKTPRIPFSLELKEFAKNLAESGGKLTLSKYLRQQISNNINFSHSELLKILSTGQWVLILDGLDEVPSSSNRQQVIESIRRFTSETRSLNIDLMIISSTRPEGYEGEFEGDILAEFKLTDLSEEQALTCASLYISAKSKVESDQQAKRILEIIKTAINNPLISKLMVTPLQVTFMVTVVEATGKPSESKWQLFHDYYTTIYARELHKAVAPYDQVLGRQRSDINALHHKAGFLLQYKGERSGGTSSTLHENEFDSLIEESLIENGHCNNELKKLKELIIGASAERLVFLSRGTPKTLSFRIRSLQEYMAAACLTDDDSDIIINRLKKIAHSAYWRNTLLFAVGRFFSDSQLRKHREKISFFCNDLNTENSNKKLVFLGSRVAVEILKSDMTENMPALTKALSSCAIKLLDLKVSKKNDVAFILYQAYRRPATDEYLRWIEAKIGQKSFSESITAWMLLFYLDFKEDWQLKLFEKYWPTSPIEAVNLISFWSRELENTITNLLLTKLEQAIPKLSPHIYYDSFLNPDFHDRSLLSDWHSALIALETSLFYTDIPLNLNNESSAFAINIHCLPDTQEATLFNKMLKILNTKDTHSDWLILSLFKDFYSEPTYAVYKEIDVTRIISASQEFLKFLTYWLPWPLVCIFSKNLIFAKNTNFYLIESVWCDSSISIPSEYNEKSDFIPLYLAALQATHIESGYKGNCVQICKNLISFFLSIPENKSDIKESLSWMLVFYTSVIYKSDLVDPQIIKSKILPHRKFWVIQSFRPDMNCIKNNHESWLDFYDELGKSNKLAFYRNCNVDFMDYTEWLVKSYLLNMTQSGLINCCAAYTKYNRKIQNTLELPLISTCKDFKSMLALSVVKTSFYCITEEDINHIIKNINNFLDNSIESSIDILVDLLDKNIKTESKLMPLLVCLYSTTKNRDRGEDYNSISYLAGLLFQQIESTSSNLNEKFIVESKLPLISLTEEN